MIPVAITSLNLSEKGHKIPVTGSEKLLGCQGSLTVAIPAIFSAYLSQELFFIRAVATQLECDISC